MTDVASDPYVVERIRTTLAQHPRVNELGIVVARAGNRVFLTGSVTTVERQRAIGEVIREAFPDLEVENDVRVQEIAPPGDRETLG